MTHGAAPRERRSDALRNQQELLRAATAAVHRDGLHVPMGTIAADAGVGIGTLYRHFPTRGYLLNELTHRSFQRVLANAHAAEDDGASAFDCLRLFVDAAITQRNELVLPLHGGPEPTSSATRAVRTEVHTIVQRIIDRGVAEGTLLPGLAARDVIVFGAMLAQPRPTDPEWDETCRRLLATYLHGAQHRP